MSCCMYLFNPTVEPQDLSSFRFDLGDLKSRLYGYKGKRRYLNQLEKFETLSFFYKDPDLGIVVHDELIEGEIEIYTQGWFFKKRFLNRKYPVFVATTKKGMINFMNKNLKSNSSKVVEKYNKFVDSWHDGMVFYCSF